MGAELVLVASGLRRRFQDLEALRGLDLEVGAGECVAILGHNGSGKTTAVRLIAGLLEPTNGSVSIDGVPVVGTEASVWARAQIAVVTDTSALYEDLSVLEHLQLAALAHAISDEGLAARMSGLLAQLGLASKAHARPGQLSRGMRQKVSLACALIRPFELLVLDEPVVGLDPQSQHTLRTILCEVKRSGRGVLLTTHQLEFARGLADRAIILADGELIAEGPYDEVVDGDVAVGQGLR